jgi:MoxR-like ATPase
MTTASLAGSVATSVEEVSAALAANGYLADEGLATVIFLAMALKRPLLLEGEAGVGKTEVAKVLSRWTGGELLRLQCYEGIDVSQAVYEWDYSRQLLHLRAAELRTGAGGEGASIDIENELYSERFLVRRALLRAIDHGDGPPPILLIDEVDRADDEFEAFLLEVLSDYAITVPELGTFVAKTPPIVILTSNRTRDVHDALKRRCLYHWVEHPGFEREVEIVRMRTTGVSESLARQVAAAVEQLRGLELFKPPGVAETIDWTQSLAALGRTALDEASVNATLGTVLKYREDADRVKQAGVAEIVRNAVLRGSSGSSGSSTPAGSSGSSGPAGS